MRLTGGPGGPIAISLSSGLPLSVSFSSLYNHPNIVPLLIVENSTVSYHKVILYFLLCFVCFEVFRSMFKNQVLNCVYIRKNVTNAPNACICCHKSARFIR